MSDHIEHPCSSCGSLLHHTSRCPTELAKRRETVEIVSDFGRTCCKCKKTVYGKALSFHWSELRECFEASQVEMPKGWATLYNPVYFNTKQETPTIYSIPLCPDCLPSVLEFIRWEQKR
jgi:hypothetical protein